MIHTAETPPLVLMDAAVPTIDKLRDPRLQELAAIIFGDDQCVDSLPSMATQALIGELASLYIEQSPRPRQAMRRKGVKALLAYAAGGSIDSIDERWPCFGVETQVLLTAQDLRPVAKNPALFALASMRARRNRQQHTEGSARPFSSMVTLLHAERARRVRDVLAVQNSPFLDTIFSDTLPQKRGIIYERALLFSPLQTMYVIKKLVRGTPEPAAACEVGIAPRTLRDHVRRFTKIVSRIQAEDFDPVRWHDEQACAQRTERNVWYFMEATGCGKATDGMRVSEMHAVVRDWLDLQQLNDIDREMLTHIYGLDGALPQSVSSVAKKFGMNSGALWQYARHLMGLDGSSKNYGTMSEAPGPSSKLKRSPWATPGALCADEPDKMFPQTPAEQATAATLCRKCRLIELCGEFALATGEQFGVWGGMTERERKAKLRQSQSAPGVTKNSRKPLRRGDYPMRPLRA